jgi:hypothetical protein
MLLFAPCEGARKMKLIQIVIMASMSLVATAVLADIVYHSVDENGIPTYSDRPSSDGYDDTVELNITATNYSAVEQGKKSAAELARAAKIREGYEAEDAANAAQTQATVAEQRASNCAAAQKRSEKYNTNRKLYKPLPDGGREYLSADELDAARAEAARTAEEWCS